MLRFRRKKSLAELLVKAIESQEKVNEALISDLEALRDAVIRLEQYMELVEQRRKSELKKKGKENG
jgi:hypothetical protein